LKEVFKKKIVIGLVNLIILFLFFAILEGAASFYFAYQDVSQKIKKEPFLAERLHTEYDPLLGWINKPNISIDHMYGPNVYLKTNGQRFRNKTDFTTKVPNGRIRVICSGDSFTLGYGVDNANTWCSLLELIDPRIQSVNMGQGGYGVGQAYLWYKRDGAQLDHSMHIFSFITEDFKRMMKKSFMGVPKPLIRVRNEEIVVKNTPISRLSFHKIHEKYLKFFNIVRLVDKVRGASFSDNLNKPSVLIQEDMEELIGKVFDNLKTINTSRNSKLILVHLPTQYEYRNAYYENLYQFVRQEAKKKGITYLNLVREIRRLSSSEMEKFFFQKDIKDFAYSKGHLTPIGNLFVAKKISKTLAINN
jgi:hypothetical protein